MNQLTWLAENLDKGFHRIGQIEILHGVQLPANGKSNVVYVLCHELDIATVKMTAGSPPDFIVAIGPDLARDLSTYSPENEYRFTKGQMNLRRNWVMHLQSLDELLLALEGFYPASFALWVAQQRGSLEVQNLRDKLNRQTGMYRFARSISNAGAQQLIQDVCGPEHQCAKKILWQIDAETPLVDSAASRFDGIGSGLSEPHAIPLLCREACNHFVAECRKVSKMEFEQKAAQ
jgi:4Fe-4S iron-sulfur cluster binding domain